MKGRYSIRLLTGDRSGHCYKWEIKCSSSYLKTKFSIMTWNIVVHHHYKHAVTATEAPNWTFSLTVCILITSWTLTLLLKRSLVLWRWHDDKWQRAHLFKGKEKKEFVSCGFDGRKGVCVTDSCSFHSPLERAVTSGGRSSPYRSRWLMLGKEFTFFYYLSSPRKI